MEGMLPRNCAWMPFVAESHSSFDLSWAKLTKLAPCLPLVKPVEAIRRGIGGRHIAGGPPAIALVKLVVGARGSDAQ